MKSISDVYKYISNRAIELLKNTFSEADFNKILNAFRTKRIITFRINNLKINKFDLLQLLKKENIKFKKIDLIDNAYELLIQNENEILNHPVITNGYIYLQSLSSMISSLILNPLKGDKILDIAAGPGSKTTQIADLIKNNGVIDAIEPNFIRMERLKYNCNLLGVKCVNFFKISGEKFLNNKKEIYDKILVDAPCSGEGRFNLYDKSSYNFWKENEIIKYSNIQYKLLRKAIILTKINGIIVYSTCTLNTFENENVIDKILKDNDFKIKIEPIDINLKNINEKINPFVNNFDKSISNCLRILPSKRFEGFFICKIKKLG